MNYLSLFVTVAALFLSIVNFLFLPIPGYMEVIIFILSFISFFTIALKWILFCLKEYGLFSFEPLQILIGIVKNAYSERKAQIFTFYSILIWLLFVVSSILILQISAISGMINSRTFISIFLFGIIPFSSFYYIFNTKISEAMDKLI